MPSPSIVIDPETAGITISDPDPSLSVLWDQAAQSAVIAEGTGPTIASRAYAVVHTAIFEAWAAFDPNAVGTAWGDSLQVDESAITYANKSEAMSYAAYVALVDLFPAQTATFDALMGTLGYDTDLQAVSTQAGTLGLTAGSGVVAAFADDGANQANGYADTTGYAPVNPNPDQLTNIASWTPEYVPIDSTDPASLQSFLTPHWGQVDGFALTSGEALRPDAPEPFLKSPWLGTVDMDARTLTIDGISADATMRDISQLRRFLLNEAELGLERRDINKFAKEAKALISETPDGQAAELKKTVTLEISKDLIGPVINRAFIDQAKDVIAESAALGTTEKVVAEFWEDGGGTAYPPGTWMSFAQYVSARDDQTLDQDAQMFFMMGNAVFDAGIATWEAKAHYDYARPVAVVRDLGELGLIGRWDTDYLGNEGYTIRAYAGPDLGTKRILATDFITYQKPGADPSPPFAEYVSGHSTFSAAGAEVLSLFTGSDSFGAAVDLDFLLFESTPDDMTPVTLSWDTFDAAAYEAGISRIYGGIHFDDGNLNGLTLGETIGAQVYDAALSFIDGSADVFDFV